ncbi:hypothetical protein FAGAP_1224 [Fusarium agapanthi]|uniref:Uncharacterized protein n=1 Tax=Fusarium agapanthi TaxID=1803897 RepID=A0A9P5BJK4_9HYPO|nr:hypothetical protein FAGAP_1224 [Fusarium agapanthi]
MALQYAIVYIGVIILAFVSGINNNMFHGLVEEVHHLDHWDLDRETDGEDWESDEDDSDEEDDDDESDDEGYCSGICET